MFDRCKTPWQKSDSFWWIFIWWILSNEVMFIWWILSNEDFDVQYLLRRFSISLKKVFYKNCSIKFSKISRYFPINFLPAFLIAIFVLVVPYYYFHRPVTRFYHLSNNTHSNQWRVQKFYGESAMQSPLCFSGFWRPACN